MSFLLPMLCYFHTSSPGGIGVNFSLRVQGPLLQWFFLHPPPYKPVLPEMTPEKISTGTSCSECALNRGWSAPYECEPFNES